MHLCFDCLVGVCVLSRLRGLICLLNETVDHVLHRVLERIGHEVINFLLSLLLNYSVLLLLLLDVVRLLHLQGGLDLSQALALADHVTDLLLERWRLGRWHVLWLGLRFRFCRLHGFLLLQRRVEAVLAELCFFHETLCLLFDRLQLLLLLHLLNGLRMITLPYGFNK